MNKTRRAFLGTSVAVAAHVWVPKPVKGYTTAEIVPVIPQKAGISKFSIRTEQPKR